ncbi:hypothetical protein [Thiothrix subterranea]|uniref:Uncharacterized protein n=1 Tax=Thiothrix subterranea TaxID=2735563 RepID=A0AA51MN66_9GAMM|nr:hypothetical protein [Thiothrix subterranea]MDQ5769136.1 hypothetical protein [Thiothrix subterranea]WML87295.1 hypothetical protein RCG00_02795 [Thiothrix subterranea]
MLKTFTWFMVSFIVMLSGIASAHDGIAHHAETHNDMAHFAAHTLMALPVVIAVWLLVWGAKRFIAKRAVLRKRG